ncbi:MAG: penicillin acylase family protein [Candidatus Aminicenantes bacterium]|nr:MAG: penicillin acylase family protein [Candidatus Aminicenantes bacterium]
MRKILGFAAILLIFFLIGFFLFFFIYIRKSIPNVDGEVSLEDLTADVRIITDTWGVPHIFAQNENDLFFACGFVHARERMWQMELSRRAGLGRLSEIFGKETLERDMFARNLGLKEAASKDLEMLSSKMKDLLISYSQGVNSWINSRRFNWPPEFLFLRYRPEQWSIMDSLIIKELMALLLCGDYVSEFMRAKLVKKLGTERALQILEDGIEIPSFQIEDLTLDGLLHVPGFQGSNNWVLAGNRTESGKPLLANDPHLEISLPPVWYEIHLHCPTLNAVGVTIPGVPLVIIGHNGSIAWGITNSCADVQDLYIERLNSSKDMYLDKDGWKPLLKSEQMIWIKGEKRPETIEIGWTAHGPLISPIIIKSQNPLSLRWTIYEGGRTLESIYLLNKAQDWREFQDALKLFDSPSQNFVYADRLSNIGYYLSGKIPLRKEEAALFPYPDWKADGSWEGYLKEEEKPHIYNPDDGFIVTANNKIIPQDFPYYVSFDWGAPFRVERIKELLFKKDKHTVESLKGIQNDIFSKKGEHFLPLLREIKGVKGNSNEALDIIKNWDLLMTSGKEAALFKVFMDSFHAEVFQDELGEDFESFDLLFRRKRAGLLRILSDPLSPWFDRKDTPTGETREDIVKSTLEKAYNWMKENYGSPENWDWVKMNSVHFQHALGRVPALKFFNRGSYPVNGDAFTVRAAYSKEFGTTHGASYRQIIDLSDLRNSICVLTSGQSGHFLSRFYDDQIPLWLEGRYHPMLFYPEDIEKNSTGLLVLESLINE